MIIKSPDNRIFKDSYLLKDKKNRQKSKLFLVEGQKQINEIDSSWNIQQLFISESFASTMKHNTPNKTFILSDSLFNKLSYTETPQGIIAFVEKKSFELSKVLQEEGFFVILENIQDPGNLGTIIRSSDAFGAKAVFISKGSADVYCDKTVRSTMGSIFHIPIFPDIIIENILQLMKNEQITTFAASLDAKTYVRNYSFSKKSAIIIGNESKGITETTISSADKLIKIKIPGNAESLNAAIAASIIMYELSLSEISII